MGIRSWWLGPAERTSEDGEHRETRCEFGGQTIYMSHYLEIKGDFESACDEVRLLRADEMDDSYARHNVNPHLLAPNPAESDDAALESLVLVGYVDDVRFPVIRFRFGSRRPGVLEWDPIRVSKEGYDLHHALSQRLTATGATPEEFTRQFTDLSQRHLQALGTAFQAAKRRVLEAGRGRSTPRRRRAHLYCTALWLAATGLLVWFALASTVPVAGLVIAAIALATTAVRIQGWIQRRLQDRHQMTWRVGPSRLRVTSRAEVREARENSKRDLWAGVAGAGAGAILTLLGTWLLS